MSSDIVLSARNISKSYRKTIDRNAADPRSVRGGVFARRKREAFRALDDVSFDITAGESIGLIGGNGAGKSTLLKILSRVTYPEAGEVDIQGRVGSLLEVGAGFHPELTGRENIFLNGAILGMNRRTVARRFDDIVGFAGIGPFLDTPVKRYSSGMYVRLAFSVAVHLDADIILVDEVLAVGDVAFQRHCLSKLAQLTASGVTIMCVSHSMVTVSAICSRGIYLREGRVEFDGDSSPAIRRYMTDAAPATSQSPGVYDLATRHNPYTPLGPIIRSVRLSGPSGVTQNTFEMGSSFRVDLDCQHLDELPDVEYGVAVRSEIGVIVLGATTYMKALTAGRAKGTEASIGCVMPRLPLMPGRYLLDISVVASVTAERIDYVERAVAFDVIPADVFGSGHVVRGDEGLVFVEFDWHVGDLPESHPSRPEP